MAYACALGCERDAGPTGSRPTIPEDERPPSILLVTLDTLRRDHVGAYGDRRGSTPHLDALAARGMVHDAAYTTMPTTGPAHLSLLTGLHPREHSGLRNGLPLPKEWSARDAAKRLRARGYATAAFVTARLINRKITGLSGFEVYDGPRGAKTRPGREAVEAALRWLDVEPHRPVFMWIHLYDAHAPYGTEEEKAEAGPVDSLVYGWFDAARFARPGEHERMLARYLRGVRTADRNTGAVIDGVRMRLSDEPVVLVASDHGESLQEHMATRSYAYDHGEYLDMESVAIPLIVAGPEIPAGRSSGTASIRDLYTTILSVAGVSDPEAETEGRRDLRTADDARRTVLIQRRAFLSPIGDDVKSHAFAAAEGDHLAIVGEDGLQTDVGTPVNPGLVAAARAHREGLAPDAPTVALDEETRDTLRELGYVE